MSNSSENKILTGAKELTDWASNGTKLKVITPGNPPEFLTAAQLKERIDSKTAPRITRDYIESCISKVDYLVLPDSTVTICNIVLYNGFSVRGESACVSKENFDEKIGRSIAYENAFEKLWQLFGFLLADTIFKNNLGKSIGGGMTTPSTAELMSVDNSMKR